MMDIENDKRQIRKPNATRKGYRFPINQPGMKWLYTLDQTLRTLLLLSYRPLTVLQRDLFLIQTGHSCRVFV
jgi:hypothetical protein